MGLSLPGWLLTEWVTIEAYVGNTVSGPVFDPPQVVRAHVQETAALGRESSVTSRAGFGVWLRPGPTCPVGSRVAVRDRVCTVVSSNVNTGNTLPTPAHIELGCEVVDMLTSTTVTVISSTGTVTGIPAQLVVADQARWDNANPGAGDPEQVTFRLRPGVAVKAGDRVRDERTLRVYVVVGVTVPQTTTGPHLGGDDIVVTAHPTT